MVNAPLEKTFTLFNDTTKMKQWMPGFVSITNISGQPNTVGSKWKLVLEQDGQLFEMTETMTAFKQNEQFAFLLENEVLSNECTISFKPNDNQTEIISDNVVHGNNMLWKSAFFFFKDYFRETGQTTYDNLKKMIETTP